MLLAKDKMTVNMDELKDLLIDTISRFAAQDGVYDFSSDQMARHIVVGQILAEKFGGDVNYIPITELEQSNEQ